MLAMQVDLNDLWRGRMSFRRLRILLDGLPMNSAYQAALRDSLTPEQMRAAVAKADRSKHGRWSLEAMLAARNGDLLEALVWQNAGNASAPKPKPYPRPGADAGAPRLTDAALDYLLKTRELRGAHPDGW